MPSASRQLSHWGHQLDSHWRRYRCVLNFTRYRRYRQWLLGQSRILPVDLTPERPLVVFDFVDTRIDGPQGRRFYHLFIFFVRAGFYPVIRENYLFLHNMEARFKGYCCAENFTVIARSANINRPHVLVTDQLGKNHEAAVNAPHCLAKINVDYTPGYSLGEAVFPLPFPMFPAIYKTGQDYQLGRYRAQARQWRLLFGGDAHVEKYTKASISNIYQKLPRAKVLACVSTHLAAPLCVAPANQAELADYLTSTFAGLVLINTRHCKIAPECWLETLAKAHFFLACPGVRYPMSHNLIESLAVGSIPILQYPELLFPPLENGKNCLVYANEGELIALIERVIAMPAAEIDTLAKGAITYYEKHLAPEVVIQQMLDSSCAEIKLRIMPSMKVGGGYV